MHIDADLRMEIGDITAHLRSEDDELVLTTDNPAELLGHLGALRSAAGPVGGRLLTELVPTTTLRLVGPAGPVATVRITDGRLDLRHVQVHRPGDLVTARVRRTAAVIGALIVAAVIVGRLLRGRAASDSDA